MDVIELNPIYKDGKIRCRICRRELTKIIKDDEYDKLAKSFGTDSNYVCLHCHAYFTIEAVKA